MIKYQIPNTKYQNTKYQNTKFQNTKYQNTKYQNTKYSRPWNAVNSQKIPLTIVVTGLADKYEVWRRN